MHLIEVLPGIATPFPTPTVRTNVAEWLGENATEAWRVVHEGPPWADLTLASADQTDAALFRLSWK
jgi:hypothetical protein